jgi:hypothetical protein
LALMLSLQDPVTVAMAPLVIGTVLPALSAAVTETALRPMRTQLESWTLPLERVVLS